MRKTHLLVLLNIFLIIVQTSFLYEIFGAKMNPNLLAATVFALVLIGDTTSAYLSALIGGLFLDIISGGVIGLGAFILTLFVMLHSYLYSFYLRNVFIGVVFATLCFYAYRLLLSRDFIFDGWLLAGSLLTAVIGQLLSIFLKGWNEKTTF
jgi:hypothetical protein